MTKPAKIPQSKSAGEEEFAIHCKLELTEQPEREFKFHPSRLWRVDFAWPAHNLAVEIESSVHRIKHRFASDLGKYNALSLGGWILLRYTARMVKSAQAINEVKAFLQNHGPDV